MENIKIYMIRNSKGEFVGNRSSPRGIWWGNAERAIIYPNEEMAKAFIQSVCKQNNFANILDATVIQGEFVPKEGYKALDEIMSIKRFKKLYDIMKTELTIPELLLFSAAADKEQLIKHPICEKLENKGLGIGFDKMRTAKTAWRSVEHTKASFELFKKLSYIVMNDKYKEGQK